MSFYSAPLNAKRLEILHELVPKPAVIAALTDANFGDADLRPMEAAARTLGRQLLIVKAGTESEIDSAAEYS